MDLYYPLISYSIEIMPKQKSPSSIFPSERRMLTIGLGSLKDSLRLGFPLKYKLSPKL